MVRDAPVPTSAAGGSTVDETVLPPAALVGTGASRTITVPSGDHAIALTRDRYLPWLKQMYLPPGEEIRLSVFMFPQFTNGVVLLEKDEEYKTGQAAIAQTSTPTEQTPLVSQDEPIEVFIRDNTLVARFVGEGNPPAYFCANAEDPCDNEHIALTFDAEVRGVAFWPGHEGVLFIAVQDGVFAFEMDTRGRQNFQPIYRGIRPNFGLAGGAFYISDSTSLFKISFVPGN